MKSSILASFEELFFFPTNKLNWSSLLHLCKKNWNYIFQIWAYDHLRIATTCLQRPPFRSPIWNFYYINYLWTASTCQQRQLFFILRVVVVRRFECWKAYVTTTGWISNRLLWPLSSLSVDVSNALLLFLELFVEFWIARTDTTMDGETESHLSIVFWKRSSINDVTPLRMKNFVTIFHRATPITIWGGQKIYTVYIQVYTSNWKKYSEILNAFFSSIKIL